MADRLRIDEVVFYSSPHELSGNVEEIIATLNGYILTYGRDITLNWDLQNYNDGDFAPEYKIIKSRPETDSEFERRMVKLVAKQTHLEKCELKEYQRLQKKFGKIK